MKHAIRQRWLGQKLDYMGRYTADVYETRWNDGITDYSITYMTEDGLIYIMPRTTQRPYIDVPAANASNR